MTSLRSAKWTVHIRATNEGIAGASTLDVISQLRQGKLARSDLVWTEGQQDWIEIGQLESLLLAEIRGPSTDTTRITTSPQVRSIDAPPAKVVQQPSAVDLRSPPQDQQHGATSSSVLGTNTKPDASLLGNGSGTTQHSPLNNAIANPPITNAPSNITGANFSTNGDKISHPRLPDSETAEERLANPVASTAEELSDVQLGLGVFSAEEIGVIKAYDHDKRRGLILVEGKGGLRFLTSSLPENAPRELVGSKVSAHVKRDNKGVIVASSVKILSPPPFDAELSRNLRAFQDEIEQLAKKKNRGERVRPGDLLTRWSNLGVDPTNPESSGPTQNWDDMSRLAELCLKEPWCFEYDKDRDKHSILRKYIKYTFYRVFREGKIAFSKTHATFNTGLVDELFEPIFALFARNTRLGSRPYRFVDFCVVGDQGAGQLLMQQFALPDRPEPAQYMTSFDEVIFDPRCPVNFQARHVVDDAILRARYPLEFLIKHMPSALRGQGEPNIKSRSWLEKYVAALNSSPQKKRAFVSDIKYATEFARKRTRWNYKTAIPNYFPRRNEMSLLLPLALMDESKPDMALVAIRVNNHEYYGVTVYPLDMAYESARLVCRPDSDWLTAKIAKASDVADDDSEDDEDEAVDSE